MQKNIEIEGAHILLDTPEAVSNTVILFIPGVSGEARGDRFLPLVQVALRKGYAIARVDMWESKDDLMKHTLRDIFSTLDRVCTLLMSEGYTRIIGVGKSFGGGVVCAYEHPIISQKIGWAPAFGIRESGNIMALLDIELGTIANVQDIYLDAQKIGAYDGIIGIVHGTEDNVVLLQNSRDIVERGAHGTLIEVRGADHSFKTPEAETALMQATERLLQ